jgi:hypothetical protein
MDVTIYIRPRYTYKNLFIISHCICYYELNLAKSESIANRTVYTDGSLCKLFGENNISHAVAYEGEKAMLYLS